MFEKDQQLELLSCKCFHKISDFHALHSTWIRGNRLEVFYKKLQLSTVSTVLYKFTHDSGTWKECNGKKAQHEKSATQKISMKRTSMQQEKRATWKECNTKIVPHGKRKIWKECNTKKVKHEYNTKRVKKVKQGENIKSERNNDTLKRVQLEKSAKWKKYSTKKTWKVKEIAKHEKSVSQKKCNIHKRITDRPLTDCDTLILRYAVKRFVQWHVTASLLSFNKVPYWDVILRSVRPFCSRTSCFILRRLMSHLYFLLDIRTLYFTKGRRISHQDFL